MTWEWSATSHVDAYCQPTMRGLQPTCSSETTRAVIAAVSVSVGRHRDVSLCSSEGSEVAVQYNLSASNFQDTVVSPTEFHSNAGQIGRAMHATVDSAQTTEKMLVMMALQEATIKQRPCCTLL